MGEAAAAADMPLDVRIHDYFNLAALPPICALTVLALLNTAVWSQPLVFWFGMYVIADTVWIALKPGIVASPLTLIGHHLVTISLLWNALTYAPHLHFAKYMTIVEVNTFFLIAKRHLKFPLLELLFKLSWLGIRVIWFPIFAVWVTFFTTVPFNGLGRRLSICGCICSLALLQLKWTYDAIIAPMLNKGGEKAPSAEEGDADGKEGFL